MKLTGAEIIIESLKREKVEVVFGYPGSAVIPIFHYIFDAPFKFILPRHEQGGIHAADGYARASGKPGVVIATSGPGATNLVTGIATANMDSIPLVVITGQVARAMIGNDAFQEVDIVGVTRPIVKHSYLVQNIKDLAKTIKEAFHIASTGRPGPVLIDVPVDITTESCEFDYPEEISIRGYKPTYEGNPRQIKLACEVVAKSKRPVIYAGGGVILSNAADELAAFARKTNIPVTTTLLGLGSFPETDELSLKMLGMYGTYYANQAIDKADLIIAVGARFDDRVTGKIESFSPSSKVIHIDIDPSSVSKNIEVDIPIVGNCKPILREMTAAAVPPDIGEWLAILKELKGRYPYGYTDSDAIIKPQFVVQELYRLTKGDAVICTEVGQNQLWAAQFYEFTKPRTFISSGGFGTMGYGLPAAIGAQLARPDKRVIDIAGDGSIQMNIQELIVASQHRLPVIIAILNNGFLGMVRQWQQMFWERRYSHTCIDFGPDFVKLAEAYSAAGFKITEKKDVAPAIEKALAITDRPIILDFHVAREENVFPFVPAGKSLEETIMGEKE